MNTRHLVDAIVRQTTVLIAQVSTASGVRSPLAHLADQVFLSLSREIESQGVSRKVAADMFGLALRSYQRKVQRVLDVGTRREQTLWEAMIAFLTEEGPVTRARLLAQFSGHEEPGVLAVAADLVDAGLAYRSGRGDAALYGVLPEALQARFAAADSRAAFVNFVWLAIFRDPRRTAEEITLELAADPGAVADAITALVADGRVQVREAGERSVLEAAAFVIPLGSREGWQAAVFDHFQAVTTAIAAKLRQSGPQSAAGDQVGGTTLHFGVHGAHPHAQEVLGTLRRTRESLEALWNRVTEYNREHPVPEEDRTVVTFYFGQTVRRPDDEETP